VFSNIADWVIDVIASIGPVGVALLVFLENLFPPIPSELVLPFAGFAAGRGDAPFVVMVVAATVGSVAGALVLYGASSWIGPVRLRAAVSSKGRFLGVRPADLERAEHWFDNHRIAAVLAGRCVPLVRSLVSIPAGFRRMPLTPFVCYTAAGSLVWNVALIGAGALLGEQWHRVEKVLGAYQLAVIAAIGGAVLLFVIRVVRRWQRNPASARG
jgi:membrane protein DedA with SNARE-associated domain